MIHITFVKRLTENSDLYKDEDGNYYKGDFKNNVFYDCDERGYNQYKAYTLECVDEGGCQISPVDKKIIPQKLIEKYQRHEILIKDIEKQLNIRSNKIYRYFKELGIRTNYYKTKKIKRNIDIVMLYESGYTIIQLGQIFNISKQRVSQIIQNRAKYEN